LLSPLLEPSLIFFFVVCQVPAGGRSCNITKKKNGRTFQYYYRLSSGAGSTWLQVKACNPPDPLDLFLFLLVMEEFYGTRYQGGSFSLGNYWLRSTVKLFDCMLKCHFAEGGPGITQFPASFKCLPDCSIAERFSRTAWA